MAYIEPLTVYIVWHPKYNLGAEIGHKFFGKICRDTESPLGVYTELCQMAFSGQRLVLCPEKVKSLNEATVARFDPFLKSDIQLRKSQGPPPQGQSPFFRYPLHHQIDQLHQSHI